MFPILNIGPLAIQTPGLIIIIGIYISILVVEKYSIRFSIKPNDSSNIIYLYVISTVIIGRIAYFFRFPSIFLENPLSTISLNPNLIDFSSGMIFSVFIAIIYIQKKKLKLLSILDSLSLGLIIFLLFFFFAQFASGNLYGRPTNLPWSVFLWGTTRHPLQLYYVIGLIPIFFLIIQIMKKKLSHGILFSITSGYLAIMTIFLDFFNGNPNNKIGNLNILQITAWIILVATLFIINKKKMDNQQLTMD